MSLPYRKGAETRTSTSLAQGPELCTEQDLECRAGTLDTVYNKCIPWGLEREGWRLGCEDGQARRRKIKFSSPEGHSTNRELPCHTNGGNYRCRIMSAFHVLDGGLGIYCNMLFSQSFL